MKIEDLEDLKSEIEKDSLEASIGVEALIFDNDLNWILMERGPECRDEVGKLEGVGGSIEDSDQNLIDALEREINEEVGEEAEINVIGFFEWRRDIPDSGEEWLIVSYLCKLEGGNLKVKEPSKNRGFHRVKVEEVDDQILSSSAKKARRTLQENWRSIEKKVKY